MQKYRVCVFVRVDRPRNKNHQERRKVNGERRREISVQPQQRSKSKNITPECVWITFNRFGETPADVIRISLSLVVLRHRWISVRRISCLAGISEGTSTESTTLHYTILSSPSRRQIDNRVDQRVNGQKCFSSLRSRGWVASWSRRLRRRRRLRQQTWCDYLAKPGKSVKFEN